MYWCTRWKKPASASSLAATGMLPRYDVLKAHRSAWFCMYFDQKYHHAGRGYGYVATSRFRSRGGCYLYGHMRRTDFLPVGGSGEDEVLKRGYDSLSEDDSDEEGPGREYADEDNVFNVDVSSFVESFGASDFA